MLKYRVYKRVDRGDPIVSTWSWISGKREREVLLRSIEHLNKVLETAKHLNTMLDYIYGNKLTDAVKEFKVINKAEEAADEIKRKIIDDLSRGVFHPLDREELLRLVLSSDDIAAYIKASAKKLIILIELGYRFDSEIIAKFKTISENLVKAVELVIEAVKTLTKSVEKSIMYTHMIEEIEEKIDDLKIEALKLILRTCGREFDGYCMLLKEALDDLEMASDWCEDTGDIIRSIAISHS